MLLVAGFLVKALHIEPFLNAFLRLGFQAVAVYLAETAQDSQSVEEVDSIRQSYLARGVVLHKVCHLFDHDLPPVLGFLPLQINLPVNFAF